jgi:hypothetical protein
MVQNKKFGEKYYRSSMLYPFKFILWGLLLVALIDFIFATSLDQEFIKNAIDWKYFFNHHYLYPEQFLSLLFFVIIPIFYYSIFRGTNFYEKGIVINRGLPFLNKFVNYEDIVSYRTFGIKKGRVIIVKTKEDNEFILTSNDINRVIGIFDQHGVRGDLTDQLNKKMFQGQRRIIYIISLFVLFMIIAQHSGLLHYLFRK